MCFLYKKTVYSKCGMLHKSLKCVIFQALAGLLVHYTIMCKNYRDNCEKRYCSGSHEQVKTLFKDQMVSEVEDYIYKDLRLKT